MPVTSPANSQVRSRLSAQDIGWRWTVLALAAVPLVGAFAYGYLLPMAEGDCRFQRTYGFFGPGCGLTRSFVAIAQGDWLQAIQWHAFGPFLFLLFAGSLAQAGVELACRAPLQRRWNLWRVLRRYPLGLALLAIAMLFYYGLRLWVGYATVPAWIEALGSWRFIQAGVLQL